MKSQAGYVERIDGRNFLIIPVQAGAKMGEVMKRVSGALNSYNRDNAKDGGFMAADGRTTRRYPYCRLHAMQLDRIIYDVEC